MAERWSPSSKHVLGLQTQKQKLISIKRKKRKKPQKINAAATPTTIITPTAITIARKHLFNITSYLALRLA